jgi:hypothetical protein
VDHATQSKSADNSSPFHLRASDLAEATKTRMENLATIQLQLLEDAQEASREWVDRVQAEAGMASVFASRLTAARSIPDAIAAYQEWGAQQLLLVAQDAKHWMDKTQKFIQVGARFWQV